MVCVRYCIRDGSMARVRCVLFTPAEFDGVRVQSFWEFARTASEQMRAKLSGGGMSRSAFAAELMYHLFRPRCAASFIVGVMRRFVDGVGVMRNLLRRSSAYWGTRDRGPPIEIDMNFSNVGRWPYICCDATRGCLLVCLVVSRTLRSFGQCNVSHAGVQQQLLHDARRATSLEHRALAQSDL